MRTSGTLSRTLLLACMAGAALAALPAYADPAESSAASDTPHQLHAALTPAGRADITEFAPALFSGVDAAASALGEVPASPGSLAELTSARLEAVYPVRAVVRASQAPQARAPAQAPALNEGLALVCGIVFIAYMARRKLGPMAG